MFVFGDVRGACGCVSSCVSAVAGDVSPNINGTYCYNTGLPCDFDHSSCDGANEYWCVCVVCARIPFAVAGGSGAIACAVLVDVTVSSCSGIVPLGDD